MAVSKKIVMLAAAVLMVVAAGCANKNQVAVVERDASSVVVSGGDADFGPYRSVVIVKHRLGVESPGPEGMVALLEDLRARLAATKLFEEVAYTCDFNHDKNTMLITAKYVKAAEGRPAVVRFTVTDVVADSVLATVDCRCDNLTDAGGVNAGLVDFIASHTKR